MTGIAEHDQVDPAGFSTVALAHFLIVPAAVAFMLPPGAGVLLLLGLAISASSLAAGWHLSHRLMRRLPEGSGQATPGVLRALARAREAPC